MNTSNAIYLINDNETYESRIALRVVARLNAGMQHLPIDITQRLKVSRELALQRARLTRRIELKPATSAISAPQSFNDDIHTTWWLKIASLLPIAALIGGLLMIDHIHVKSQISTAAQIDIDLLADDVPPTAYTDPGFIEFLKVSHD